MKTLGIKDSGKRESFNTGSRRDTNEGKFRFDLLPGTCRALEAAHFAMGAIKYDARNWEKGQPIMRYYESLDRHLLMWVLGDMSENHLAGIRWNTMAIQHTLLMIEHGKLAKELDDRPDYMKPDNEIGKALIAMFNEAAAAAIKAKKEKESQLELLSKKKNKKKT